MDTKAGKPGRLLIIQDTLDRIRARMNQRPGCKDAAARDAEGLMENFPEDGPGQLRPQLEPWLDALRSIHSRPGASGGLSSKGRFRLLDDQAYFRALVAMAL